MTPDQRMEWAAAEIAEVLDRYRVLFIVADRQFDGAEICLAPAEEVDMPSAFATENFLQDLH